MIRIQLHLTELQDRRLRALAKRKGTVRADLIRRGIDLLLQEESTESDSLLKLIGVAGPAGRSDIAERHDDILYVNEPASPDYARKSDSTGAKKKRNRRR
jgi:hypothetical protein